MGGLSDGRYHCCQQYEGMVMNDQGIANSYLLPLLI
jgi:hypothetical protein